MAAYTPKDIAAGERLIFALDVATGAEAIAWIERLGDAVSFYKIGLQLLTSGDYFTVLRELERRGKKIFADLKFHDVPATVAAAVKGLARYPVTFCTIHSGSRAMLEAAAAVKGDLRLLAVTVLTSLNQTDLGELDIRAELASVVSARARQALAAGFDGVVSSAQEVARLRRDIDHRLICVCPGIRPLATAGTRTDDQKRTFDAAQALGAGADYLVIGRPLRLAADPRAAAEELQASIAAAMQIR
ncbi:MAG: orotidine-5'-phosphate decarboxylase [Rudaea sp.]